MKLIRNKDGTTTLTGDNSIARFHIVHAQDGTVISHEWHDKRHARPADWPLACQLRGDLKATIKCATCKGSVGVKLYECRELVSCTISTKLEDVPTCETCDHYQPGATT